MTHTLFTCVDRDALDTETAYRLLVGCVVPRPIAWITTVATSQVRGCAPSSQRIW